MTVGQNNALQIWCWVIIAFGAIIVVAALQPVLGQALFVVFGHPEPVPSSAHLALTMSLMGAVTVGWGLTLLALARHDDSAGVWRGVTIAILIWYFVDSGLSIGTGFWRNAVSNTVLVAVYLFIRSRGVERTQG